MSSRRSRRVMSLSEAATASRVVTGPVSHDGLKQDVNDAITANSPRGEANGAHLAPAEGARAPGPLTEAAEKAPLTDVQAEVEVVRD